MLGRSTMFIFPRIYQIKIAFNKKAINSLAMGFVGRAVLSRLYCDKSEEKETNRTHQANHSSKGDDHNHLQPPPMLIPSASFVGAVAELKNETTTLLQQLKDLRSQSEILKIKHRRALTDNQNTRVRLTKEIKQVELFGKQSFCKELLDVSDALTKAANAVSEEDLKKSNSHFKQLYEGLCLTQEVLLQVLKRHGVEPINPLDEKFDPNFHEAVFEVSLGAVEPNTIVEVTKIGYTLHGRCLRAALVGISKSS